MLLSDLLSPLVAFFSAFLIFICAKQIKGYRSYGIFLSLSAFVWGLADAMWFVSTHLLHENPIQSDLFNILYISPSILFVILLAHYIFVNVTRWYFYQILVDLFTVSATGSIVLFSLILAKVGEPIVFSPHHIPVLLFILFDCIALTEISLIILSQSLRYVTKSELFALLGIVIYSYADYAYGYIAAFSTYQSSFLIDSVYMLCFILFATGAYYESIDPSIPSSTQTITWPENLRKPKKAVFLYIIVYYFFYTFGFFTMHAFLLASGICVLYWLLTTAVRVTMLDKTLLQTEKKMNEHLDRLVSERTQELNALNQHLNEISHRDALTRLYNRRYLVQYLDEHLRPDPAQPFALIYIDANRFKSINDSFGHETGDHVLRSIGARFLESFTQNCTAFRTGGDEFAVIIENYQSRSEILRVVETIYELLYKPIYVSPYRFTLTASIGISLFPDDTRDKGILMRYADMAMYEVKHSNQKNDYRFFDQTLLQKIHRKQELEFLLQNADYDTEFSLHYQPQYQIDTGELIGMEALIRWNHPQKGMISPAEFIPIAEETGAIFKIGEWVIEQALTQIKRWNNEYGLNLVIGINISPIQLENPMFVEWFWNRIQNNSILPQWIDLEITENIAMNSSIPTQELFSMLDGIGVNTSIDDFGTGYSSLSYIQKFSIDRLKIAKELIDHIDSNENALLVVKSIIMMAKGMGLKTIAEGVEETSQLEKLRMLGCDEIQGYIFGKPVASNEFERQHIQARYQAQYEAEHA